jgi:predicted nucleotide-binding protein
MLRPTDCLPYDRKDCRMSKLDAFVALEYRVEALMDQKIVRGDRKVAEALAEAGELITFAPGAELIAQGNDDTDCYFLLAGKVALRVSGETLPYGRGAGDLVGELRAINPRISRTATVTATEEVVAIRCSAERLKAAGSSVSDVWRLLAIDLASKIEQRGQLIRIVNERPKIFMIAAERRLDIAKELEAALSKDYDVDLWSENDLVPPGGYELDALHEKARDADFGIVFAHPDDLARPSERFDDEEWETIRFELGYLMSELSRHRTLVMIPAGGPSVAPRLFKGIQPMTYQLPADGTPLRVVLVEVIDAIKELVDSRKVRSRLVTKT